MYKIIISIGINHTLFNVETEKEAMNFCEENNWKWIDENKFTWNLDYEEVEEKAMTVTKTWKVYGMEGHRQKESFNKSYKYDFSEGEKIRIIEVLNSDKTGTNDYSIIKITRNTMEECEEELEGQINDGIFENSRIGKIEEI